MTDQRRKKTINKKTVKKEPLKKTTIKKVIKTVRNKPGKSVIQKAKAPLLKGALSKEQIRELLSFITQKLDEGKAEEIVTLNLEGKTSLADFLVIASGTSARHIFGLANNLVTDLKKAGYSVKLSGEKGEGNWILIDVVDIIIHLFTPQTRIFYDIEGLWGNTKKD